MIRISSDDCESVGVCSVLGTVDFFAGRERSSFVARGRFRGGGLMGRVRVDIRPADRGGKGGTTVTRSIDFNVDETEQGR